MAITDYTWKNDGIMLFLWSNLIDTQYLLYKMVTKSMQKAKGEKKENMETQAI